MVPFLRLAHCNSFVPALSSLFYGHVCADDPDLFIQEQRLRFGGFPVANTFGELVRQVGLLFGRPLHAAGQFG